MNILIVYDSLFGNTQKVAQQIADEFRSHKVRLLFAKDATAKDLDGVELLIVGSPTHASQPSQGVKDFLDLLTKGCLKNIRGAAFDTGIPAKGQKAILRLFIGVMGYADKHIAKALKKNGANVIGSDYGISLPNAANQFHRIKLNQLCQLNPPSFPLCCKHVN